MNSTVDWFFNKPSKWQAAYAELRTLMLAANLTEVLKWGCPCYTYGTHNVVLIHGFKDYCALLFMQGALLKDPKQRLIQQTKNVQAARQLRFTQVEEVINSKALIKAFVKEAIALAKAGAKVERKGTEAFEMPQEFVNTLKEMPELNTAFKALTPGRQRGYLLYFSAAKQAKTREARIRKSVQKIMNGKGLED